MNHRERMEAVFRGQRPDQMAWFGDMTYWHSAHLQIGDLPERWRGSNGMHELHRELNIGEYIPGCDPCDIVEGTQVRHEVTQSNGRRIAQWHTPVGAVREVQEYLPGSFCWGYTEHAVKDACDLRVVRYIYKHRQFKPRPERYLELDGSYATCGFGPAHYAAPPTPISELNKHWVGVMDLAYLLVDEQEEMQNTLAAIERAHDVIYRHIAAGPVGYAMICENLSAATMGGYFHEYIAPHLRRWADWLHAHGHRTLIHNDGTLRGTLEKLAAVGVDCVDSVVPKPVGDVGLDELRALAGDDIILLGGLPGAMFAPPFTARDIEGQVREIIRLHKDTGRFMFGVADQVPPNGDIRLVKLVGELIQAYGRY
ncbi:MAG TPA: uroporphyrinogen decarboxylase family protein [Armatimonadota bacterium]|nr:uroporphyrinogen decarboxylase family protein [Thermoguttaceae bacterium]HUV04851.1 uroporphyrinogen decarboxylase family protein [Armatimonadota bacterium]